MKRSKLKGITGFDVVEVDLCHWHHTRQTFRGQDDKNGQIDGYNLMKCVRNLSPGHGIKLRVTVEVLEPGIACPVLRNSDGRKCTKHIGDPK